MKAFMDEDFLLENETAKKLFHEHAAKMPIIDYHCHINPQQIAENYQFRNITDAWLSGDHYKWRMIRSNGVPEKLITGNESTDYEKFEMFAKSLPRAIGNPLYHWTHLELKRYFGITKTLSEKTCKEIWDECNAKLATDDFRVQSIIKKSNVKLVATTDDPGDSLEWHQKIREQGTCTCKVIPAWRPDKAMKIEKPGFKEYVSHIAKLVGVPAINSCEEFFNALDIRMKFFDEQGCRAADHGIDYAYCRIVSKDELEAIYQKGIKGEALTDTEIEAYKTMILIHLAKGYTKYGWVMQMHYGAIRDPNSKMFKILGADTGYDVVGNRPCAEGISQFMNALFSMVFIPVDRLKSTPCKELPMKALSPTRVRIEGRVILASEVQPLNAELPISLKDDILKFALWSRMHPWKQLSRRYCVPPGVICSRYRKSLNVLASTSATLLSQVTSRIQKKSRQPLMTLLASLRSCVM